MPDKSKFKVTYRHVPARIVTCDGFKEATSVEGFIEFYDRVAGGDTVGVYWAASEEVVSIMKVI